MVKTGLFNKIEATLITITTVVLRVYCSHKIHMKTLQLKAFEPVCVSPFQMFSHFNKEQTETEMWLILKSNPIIINCLNLLVDIFLMNSFSKETETSGAKVSVPCKLKSARQQHRISMRKPRSQRFLMLGFHSELSSHWHSSLLKKACPQEDMR